MPNLYSVRDLVAKCDVVIFVAQNNGEAVTTFRDFINKRGDFNFELYCLADIAYTDIPSDDNVYIVDCAARDIVAQGIQFASHNKEANNG